MRVLLPILGTDATGLTQVCNLAVDPWQKTQLWAYRMVNSGP